MIKAKVEMYIKNINNNKLQTDRVFKPKNPIVSTNHKQKKNLYEHKSIL